MSSPYEKMIGGELYSCVDEELFRLQAACLEKLYDY